MTIIAFSILFFLILLAITLDVLKKINLMHPIPLTLFLTVLFNPVLAWQRISGIMAADIPAAARFFCFWGVMLLIFYLWLRLTLFPVRDARRAGLRLKVMIGGRKIILTALYAMVLQGVFYIFIYRRLDQPLAVVARNALYSTVLLLILFLNGTLRVFFTSRRLSLSWRLLMIMTMWIPLINLLVLLLACRLVYEEYDFGCNKEALRSLRVDSDLCKTRYPLIMVHGILFRVLKYFNYWGRIPKELMRYGAAIYYGHQEAVGTIIHNGEDLREKILQVMAETGCEKVNIIAHSKGGLDARYAISKLGMDEYVASLTTMNTPHRGCRFVDKACRLPDWLYRFVARIFDNAFTRLGDQNPDFYTATRQFSTAASQTFNETVRDSDKVYYQSYMTKMKGMGSDLLLALPYAIIKPLEGDNDGLVSTPSAIWGDYRGLLVPGRYRGISHGDIIDLKREDYKGFDVVETYVKIVSELKERGF